MAEWHDTQPKAFHWVWTKPGVSYKPERWLYTDMIGRWYASYGPVMFGPSSWRPPEGGETPPEQGYRWHGRIRVSAECLRAGQAIKR